MVEKQITTISSWSVMTWLYMDAITFIILEQRLDTNQSYRCLAASTHTFHIWWDVSINHAGLLIQSAESYLEKNRLINTRNTKHLPRVRLELTTFRLWDWRAAYCANEAVETIDVMQARYGYTRWRHRLSHSGSEPRRRPTRTWNYSQYILE